MNKMKNNSCDKDMIINVLTRTSNRPIGFYNCRQSIVKQTYKSIKHFVSYENELDVKYLNEEGINQVKVNKYEGEILSNSEGYLHAPYNLYCNELLGFVEEGWVLFLDDDDHLLHNKVIEEIVSKINKADEDTLFIWQMRYPNGKVLPTKKHFQNKELERNNIGSPCFIFHSKYKEHAKWDQWKASDYRVIKRLYKMIPKKKWMNKVYVQINNYGDLGNRNDIMEDVVTHKLIYNKTWFWFLIPKYHVRIGDNFIFQLQTYQNLINGYIKKMKRKSLF